MKPIGIKSLSLARFNALIGAGATRSPAASFVGEELGWYSNEDESILGIVIHDLIDEYFAAVLLAKDEGGRFRSFDGTASVESEYEATEWLRGAIRWHTGMEVKVVAQGDETTGPDLFSVVAPIEKLHPDFVALARDDAFLPAGR